MPADKVEMEKFPPKILWKKKQKKLAHEPCPSKHRAFFATNCTHDDDDKQNRRQNKSPFKLTYNKWFLSKISSSVSNSNIGTSFTIWNEQMPIYNSSLVNNNPTNLRSALNDTFNHRNVDELLSFHCDDILHTMWYACTELYTGIFSHG